MSATAPNAPSSSSTGDDGAFNYDLACRNAPDCYTGGVTPRLLLTGTRLGVPDRILTDVLRTLWEEEFGGEDTVLVHGDADGTDRQAAAIWSGFGLPTEKHPANWNLPCGDHCRHRPRQRRDGTPYCPVVGHWRNQHMVDIGAQHCVGFPASEVRKNSGTWDCLSRASAAGIPTTIIIASDHRGCPPIEGN